jgi:4-hydroxybenzoate polyprenyltransferase/phosphoserine phosphatase
MLTPDIKATADECAGPPLVVDLDGTLISSDILVESTFAHIGHNPMRTLKLLSVLSRGKAAFKALVAATTEIDVARLPYNKEVLDIIKQARVSGRRVYLASASNERYVAEVALHLGLFDGWFASSANENLSSSAKANCLVEKFGERGFDYVGNDAADIAVWTKARHRIAVHPTDVVKRRLQRLDQRATILRRNDSSLQEWVRLLRIHQWAKNVLVFVPLLTAHRLDLISFGEAVAAFLGFSLAASGVYLINDLVDIDADRRHNTKRQRPLAAGTVKVFDAMIFAPMLMAVAALGGFLISTWFGIVLLSYLALTSVYTFFLKRKMIVDVVALAMLYTLRVVGGNAAIAVSPSEWLLAFSMFIFMALALIKRYTDLASRLDSASPDPMNRDYRKIDLHIVAAIAAASGFNAVTVFTLYISSDTVRQLYSHPPFLWLICPILMYWIGRILMLAHRRSLHDDPVLFAIKDRASLASAGLIGLILLAAV